jgi:hypothetical protein
MNPNNIHRAQEGETWQYKSIDSGGELVRSVVIKKPLIAFL